MSPEQSYLLLARQKATALNSTRNYERNYEQIKPDLTKENFFRRSWNMQIYVHIEQLRNGLNNSLRIT